MTSRPRATTILPIRGARIECVPFAFQEDVDPGTEIHRVNDRNADVPEIAVDIAGGNIEAAAERDGKVREVATDADALMIDLEGRPRRAGLHVVEVDVVVDEVADRLHAAPSRSKSAKDIPRRFGSTYPFRNSGCP